MHGSGLFRFTHSAFPLYGGHSPHKFGHLCAHHPTLQLAAGSLTLAVCLLTATLSSIHPAAGLECFALACRNKRGQDFVAERKKSGLETANGGRGEGKKTAVVRQKLQQVFRRWTRVNCMQSFRYRSSPAPLPLQNSLLCFAFLPARSFRKKITKVFFFCSYHYGEFS